MTGESDARFQELVAIAARRMAADGIAAVQLGVIDGDREFSHALGIADIRSGAAAGANTMFRIASITKTVTATLLVMLARRGAIDLDDPLRRYVPEFSLPDPAVADRVTIRDCLLHTGGWLPHLELIPDGPDALAVGALSQVKAEVIAPPGAVFSYNGVGYMIAGRVIEVVTGERYEDAVRASILEPLHMTRTKFTTEHDADIAGDHTVRDGTPAALDDPVQTRWGHPSGGLRSTAHDLLLWAHCHFGETEVLDREAAASMAAPRFALPNPGQSKALSWFVREIGSERLLLHLGGAVGQQSLLLLCPTRRFALVVLTNSAAGTGVINEVQTSALDAFLGLREPPPPRPIPVSQRELARYEGRFTSREADLVVARDGDALLVRIENKGAFAQRPTPPPAHIRFWDRDRVVGVDGFGTGQYGDFLRDASGNVTYFRWSGRARPRAGHDA